jgi:hypothetical protein
MTDEELIYLAFLMGFTATKPKQIPRDPKTLWTFYHNYDYVAQFHYAAKMDILTETDFRKACKEFLVANDKNKRTKC